MTWDVQDVNDEGDAVIQAEVRPREAEDDDAGRRWAGSKYDFEYDRDEGPPVGGAAMLAPMYKAMTKGEFELTMTPRGEIKDVKVPEECSKALKNSPGRAAMGDMATAEGFKKMMSQGSLVLPESAPKPGETWNTQGRGEQSGGRQANRSKRRISIEGTKDVEGKQLRRVSSRAMKMKFDGRRRWTIKSQIKEQSSDGEILFDVAEGRLHSSKLEAEGDDRRDGGGQTMKQKIDQTIEVKVQRRRGSEATRERSESARDASKRPSDDASRDRCRRASAAWSRLFVARTWISSPTTRTSNVSTESRGLSAHLPSRTQNRQACHGQVTTPSSSR